MSLRKKGVITKISSISLFIFLMLFNVKVAFSDKSSGDIDILGMKVSVSVPSAYASGSGGGQWHYVGTDEWGQANYQCQPVQQNPNCWPVWAWRTT